MFISFSCFLCWILLQTGSLKDFIKPDLIHSFLPLLHPPLLLLPPPPHLHRHHHLRRPHLHLPQVLPRHHCGVEERNYGETLQFIDLFQMHMNTEDSKQMLMQIRYWLCLVCVWYLREPSLSPMFMLSITSLRLSHPSSPRLFPEDKHIYYVDVCISITAVCNF